MLDDINKNICLKIGVTAHRDLNFVDAEAVELHIRDFFKALKREFPTLPLVLVNPLAEGGDMLVAKVALDMGIPIETPLPMPQAIYEQDFSDAGIPKL